MAEKKPKTETQIKAQKKYMSGFVEVKVRMTPDRRDTIKEYARSIGLSTTAFINQAIDAAISKNLK